MIEYTVISTDNEVFTIDALNEEWLKKICKLDGIKIKKIVIN
jgi:hypothetical protein